MIALFPYSATSSELTVRAAPSFDAERSDIDRSLWFWTYHIRVENHGDAPVQLLRRRWLIVDGHGESTRVEGEGVVGEQPVIAPGQSYDYVSGCPLPTPAGHMQGHYLMIAANRTFWITIPRIWLRHSG